MGTTGEENSHFKGQGTTALKNIARSTALHAVDGAHSRSAEHLRPTKQQQGKKETVVWHHLVRLGVQIDDELGQICVVILKLMKKLFLLIGGHLEHGS